MVDLVVVVGTCLFVVGLSDYCFGGSEVPVIVSLLMDLQVGLLVGLQVVWVLECLQAV